jgi:uncharacterized protein YjbI with pentapeptide repeats
MLTREADLTNANFTSTELHHSLFVRTNLSQANFSEVIGFHIDPRNNVLKKARFCRFEALDLLIAMDIELNG